MRPTKAQSFFSRISSAALALVVAANAHAGEANVKKLLQLPGFQGMVFAIANLNHAMESAAQNPMDDLRRVGVQNAMRAMPPAIVGLAQEFKSGKLHDSDLPRVQAILGGFVDVSAPAMYEKFLQNPSRQFIPNVGTQFPKDVAPATPANKLVNIDLVGGNAGVNPTVTQVNETGIPKEQLAQLSAPKTKANNKVTYDESAKREDDDFTATEKNNNAPASETRTLSAAEKTQLSAIEREIAQVEERSQASLSVQRDGDETEQLEAQENTQLVEQLSGGKQPSKTTTEKRPRVDKRGKPITQNYRLEAKPKFWRVSGLVVHLHEALIRNVMAAPPGGSECSGGCEGGEGEGGSKAAEILMAMAMITAAAAPMVAAAIQADADVKQTKMTTAAQERMQEKQLESQNKISEMNTRLAQEQVATTERINRENQERASYNQQMALAETRAVRQEQAAAQLKREERAQALEDRKLALAEKEIQDNLRITQQALDQKLVAAGLKPNYDVSRTASGGLSTDRLVATRSGANTAISRTTNSNGQPTTAAQANGTAAQVATAAKASSTQGNAMLSGFTGAKGNARGITSAGANRLLVASGSVLSPEAQEEEAKKKAAKKRVVSVKTAPSRGIASVSSLSKKPYTAREEASIRGLRETGLALGSTRSARVRLASTSTLQRTIEKNAEGFGTYYRGSRSAPDTSGLAHGASGRGISDDSVQRLGGYNEPSVRSSIRTIQAASIE